jgi:translation initiation factor 3 subunit D
MGRPRWLHWRQVHETAQEPIPDEKDMNGVAAMRKEATAVNRNFSQQVLQGGGAKTMGFKEANPFVKPGEDAAPVAYRYRKWKMEDGTTLTARCELQAALDYKGEQLTCTVKALNEFDPKVTGIDWRQKLETQRGAVIATELKNNSNKLAKWTVASLLAGADQMKLGYVTRAHPRDNLNHVILGTQFYKPKDFALQINLAIPNIWAILKHVVELCFKQQDGKYLLVKDPNKQLMRLYMVPNDAFDEDEFDEEPMPVSQEAPPMAPRGGDE